MISGRSLGRRRSVDYCSDSDFLLFDDAIVPNVKETKELSNIIIDSPFTIPFKPNTISVTTTEKTTIIFRILSNNKPNDFPPPSFVLVNACFPITLIAFVTQKIDIQTAIVIQIGIIAFSQLYIVKYFSLKQISCSWFQWFLNQFLT